MVGTNTKTQDILAGVDLSAFDSIGESILADPSGKTNSSSSSSNSAAPSPSVTPQPGGPSSSPAPNPVALTETSVPGSRAKSVDKGKVKEKESKGGFASFFKTKFLGGLAGSHSAATEGDHTGAAAAVETVAAAAGANGKDTNTQSELAQSTSATTTTTTEGEQSNGVSLSSVKRSTSVKSIKATSTLARKAAASPDNMDSNPSSLPAASSSFMDLGKSAFASLLRKPRSETPVEDDLLDEVPSARKTIPRKPTIPKAEGKSSSTRRSAENLDDNVTVPSLARSPSAMRTLPRKQTSKGQSTSENVNIEDQAKDGIMTLLRSASLKRSVSVKADSSTAAATPQQAASINLASAKAALKAEFNKPSLASLQAELAALRGEDPEPAPWFLAPGKKKGLAAAAAVAAEVTPDDATPKATGGKADAAGN
ncbi:hypothetical protein BJ741DRAFT_621175 [Chytriomyces cf. hyalinus JEL632]|nr:hypothetical protein BJ741DRAFT_621175 [Chytriomyces cf. hyalinus JEL632]